MDQVFKHISTSSRGVGLYRAVDAEGNVFGDGTIYVSSKNILGGFPESVTINFEAAPDFVAKQEETKAAAAAKAAEKEAKAAAKAAKAEAKTKIAAAREELKKAREAAKAPAAPAEV